MERQRQQRNGLSYSGLFDLESFMSFRVPQPDDHIHNYGDSSQDESRSSQGQDGTLDRSNGAVNGRSQYLNKGRKRRVIESEGVLDSSMKKDADSIEDDEEDYEARITEEQYRTMLGEHVQKYRRVRSKDTSSSGPASTRMATSSFKHGHATRVGKFSNEPLVSVEETMLCKQEASPRQYDDADYDAGNRFSSSLDSAYLDIGEGVKYPIPPPYDKLVTSLKLPCFSDVRIEEFFLKGPLDLRSLAAMVANDHWFGTRNRGGLCEPQPEYESLQARLKALSSSNSDQKFTLQVCDIGLDPFSIPEGAAGRIRRSIMSESGSLEIYYVKVLEKGDTYEIIERSLPKKQTLKKDHSEIEKEEMEKIRKVWVNIVRRDIPKHHRIFTYFHKKQLEYSKRFAETCQKEEKLKVSRSLRLMRGAAIRTRRLARDMLIFWKRVDKEQAELRRKEEKDAAEALKREEELREAKRQQQRLNFLISQTELYSHFMGNKPSTQPAEALSMVEGEFSTPQGTHLPEEEEDQEEAELKREALIVAQKAVSKQKKITNDFDSECLKLRQDAETKDQADELLGAGSSNIDLLNPSTMPVESTVQTPDMFKGRLKEYQLKGLQWLVNCYEQGLNGILADEMGLGKTIQAMAFLAHLAEEKNIWGPFLVVAPSSVLNNWAEEISRFCPDLKTLPYWGAVSERTILRKNLNAKRLYRKESGFHILITSYQVLVVDEKYLKKIKWQYMVLDEAQAIKSSTSLRWKTLLSFNCRNRLLLTGTPIQNNMAELWALLHFIMPTLFDSHEQFNEWFSKGIESHAEHGGTLNEHQLNRLHAVLKPFMLRRVKKDVISEMTGKTEITVHCKLSSRQQAFYSAIKNKISLAELIDGTRGHLNDKKMVNLMNIVIQLRKVCNHPELFERNEGSSYLYFADIPNSLISRPGNGVEEIYYAGGRNPIVYKVPKLIYEEIVRNTEVLSSVAQLGFHCENFERLFNVFSLGNIYQSTLPQSKGFFGINGTFGFTRLMNLSPVEVSFLTKCSLLERLLFSIIWWETQFVDETLDLFMEIEGDSLQSNHLDKGKIRAVARLLLSPMISEASLLRSLATNRGGLSCQALVTSHQDRFISNIKLLRSVNAFIPQARAPPISSHCSSRSFAYQIVEELHHPWTKKLFLGFARTSEFNGPRTPHNSHHLIEELWSEPTVLEPIFQLPYRIFGASPPMQSFDPAKMLAHSGKLQTLDILLKRLRAENHRVLLFAQMTKMLDILEDYMNYRKYKYFRLDGSSAIADRRDMVRDFQSRNDIFVFLLSTRAGGLGINLTAADTVIFYESDWNPTLDLQAMDRAHRLGQTKEVTVYRLICKETIEEKILQRASQKSTVQQLVMTGGHIQGDLLKPEDVVSLLIDDAQLEQKLREIPLQAKDRPKKKRPKAVRVDADGDVTLEELTNNNLQGTEDEQETDNNIKREANSHKQNTLKSTSPHKILRLEDPEMELDEASPSGYEEDQVTHQRPKKIKRPTKSVNENLELAFSSTANTISINSADYQPSSDDYTIGVSMAELQDGTTSQAPYRDTL